MICALVNWFLDMVLFILYKKIVKEFVLSSYTFNRNFHVLNYVSTLEKFKPFIFTCVLEIDNIFNLTLIWLSSVWFLSKKQMRLKININLYSKMRSYNYLIKRYLDCLVFLKFHVHTNNLYELVGISKGVLHVHLYWQEHVKIYKA